MPLRTLATQLFDAVAQVAPRTSDPQCARVSSTPSPSLNVLAGAPGPNVGALRYLVPLGIVATTIAVVFFGLGLFLLAHPNEELIAGISAGNGVEGEARSPDISAPLEKDAVRSKVPRELRDPAVPSGLSAPATEPSEARAVLPPANREMAWSALPTSASSAVVASTTLRELKSKSAETTPPTGTHAKRAGVSRHRHYEARKDWAGLSPPRAIGPPPLAASGPEIAWRWIVRSATNVVAALSPPPSWQAPVLKPRPYPYQ